MYQDTWDIPLICSFFFPYMINESKAETLPHYRVSLEEIPHVSLSLSKTDNIARHHTSTAQCDTNRWFAETSVKGVFQSH